MELKIYDESYSFFCEKLTANAPTILEVGCGPGNISAAMLKINPKLNILAIDYASNMVELAKKNNPKIEIKLLDAKLIHTINRKFDGVVAGFIAPYLTGLELNAFFEDVFTKLNEAGLFYLSFVAGDPSQSDFQTSSKGDRLFFNFHSINTVLDSLEKIGFDIIRSFQVHYENGKVEMDEHSIIISKK